MLYSESEYHALGSRREYRLYFSYCAQGHRPPRCDAAHAVCNTAQTIYLGVRGVLGVGRMSETIVCVGTVVRNGERILLVRQSKGHPLEGQWTIPWGRIASGESPLSAALRETKEEAGIQAAVEGLLGVQELPPPWDGWMAIVYLCKHVGGNLQPEDRETDAARYYSLAGLSSLQEPLEPWSEWLVRRVFAGRFTVTHNDSTNPFRHAGAFL